VTTRSPILRASIIGLSLFLAAGTTMARQDAAPAGATQEGKLSAVDLLKDFNHYVRIARYDLAAGRATELLSRGIKPAEFVDLVEQSQEADRFQETVVRALRVAEVEPQAAQLYKLFEDGKLSRSRDPEQIKKNIENLTGSIQARLIAQQRLKAAGEYSTPQLLEALFDSGNRARQTEVQRVLIDLGRQSIAPLTAALMGVDPVRQEAIINVLGNIPYRTSLPFLTELAQKSSSNEVKQAATRAIERIAGSPGAAGDDVSALYLALGEDYYAEKSELVSFPGEDFQLLWNYDASGGLQMTPVRTAVFNEAMAMKAAEHALKLSPANEKALALWVASNFSREIQSPAGYDNPSYPSDRRDAMYFAVASGAKTSQRVLGRAIDTRNTLLARRSLEAVGRTAGGSALWASEDNRSPLLEALTYQNRRVQYDAALALASAQIKEKFAGSERVVPTLASAIRGADAKFAAVLAPDNERYTALRGILEKQGYTVLSFGRTVEEISGPVAEVPAVDVLVAAGVTPEKLASTVDQVRANVKLTATPVLLLTSPEAYAALRRQFERDGSVAVRQSAMADADIGKSIEALVESASGGTISGDEARSYADRSLDALRDLAVSGNQVFSVGDAMLPLIAALETKDPTVQLRVAEVLSRIADKQAQVAVMDAALAATGPQRVALLGKVADSAKRSGANLEERQVKRVLELATDADPATSTAAAALAGALSLPNADLVPLILGEKK
jgi:hypothetical protein